MLCIYLVLTNMQLYDGRLHHPSTMLICGPSNSGKTTFTKKILKYSNSLFTPYPPRFVVLVYETWQSSYDEMLQHNYIHLAIKGLSDIDCPIAQKGHLFIKDSLNMKDVEAYWIELLTKYAQIMSFVPTVDKKSMKKITK